eukprot:2829285-Prymnesium_polylepis.1
MARNCSDDSPRTYEVAAHVDALRGFVDRRGANESASLVVFDGDETVVGEGSSQGELLAQVGGMANTTDLLILGWCDTDAAAADVGLPRCVNAYAVRERGATALLSQLDACGAPFETQLAGMHGIAWERVRARTSALGLVHRRTAHSVRLVAARSGGAPPAGFHAPPTAPPPGGHPLGAGL